MELKKLTAQEIIEILKQYTTVEEFCDDFPSFKKPEEFEYSQEVLVKQEAYEKAYREWRVNGTSWQKDNVYYQAWENNPEPVQAKQLEIMNFLGLGKVEEVDSYGGEDCGSTYYSIKHFVDHDVYLRVDGWYQSHYGTDFGDWDDAVKEVKPKVKTVTVFE